jgi:hypothetical protein
VNALLLLFAVATIPFRWTPGQIEVEVSIDGQPPVWFLVDSGAEGSFLARSIAGDGGDVLHDVSLRIGPVELAHQDVRVLPLENFKKQGRSIVGLIGYDLFRRYVVTIDYAAQTLTLDEPRSFRRPRGAIVVPITFAGRLAAVPVTIDSLPARLTIDTGASEPLILRHPFAEAHGLLARAENPSPHLNVEGRTLTFLRLPVARLMFAGRSFETLTAKIYATNAGAGGFTGTDGLIGNEILRRFRVSIDYEHRKLYLVP